MFRIISVTAVALAAVGFASSAMAVSSSGGTVGVNIEVHPIVSMWANDANVNLELTGANIENSDTFASGLSVINNVDANISASVAGNLPADVGGHNALNFFIFNGAEVDAQAAIVLNSNAPVGALVWNDDNIAGPNSQQLLASTGVNPNIATFPIVYAADAPNNLPAVAEWNLTVTYTITSNI